MSLLPHLYAIISKRIRLPFLPRHTKDTLGQVGKIVACGIMVLLVLAAIGPPVSAQDGAGGVPGSFLYMGVGSRALAMGGAYTALANDATAVYWNPAGLAGQNPFQFSFMHGMLFAQTSIDFLAATAPTRKFGSFGAGLLSLSSNGFEQRTELNEVVGEFGTQDLGLLLSWSKQVWNNISMGLSYKFVNQSILEYSGSGHGLDLGLQGLLFERVRAGIVARNILSPKMTLAQETQSFPLQLSSGLATSLLNDQLTLSVEFTKISGWGKSELRLGIEYKVLEQTALRLGLNQNSFTLGAALQLNSFGLGYSNTGHSELGASHRFELSYMTGGFGIGARAEPRMFSPAGEINLTHIRLNVHSRSELESWFFAILDENERIVQKFEASGMPPEEIVWDGRDSMGALVADGTFRYMFTARTLSGEGLEADGELVAIDSSGPNGLLISSNNGDE